jgi:hypothetical protein
MQALYLLNTNTARSQTESYPKGLETINLLKIKITLDIPDFLPSFTP